MTTVPTDGSARAPSAVALPSDQDASGRSFGPEELERVAAVLESGTLTCTKGSQTPELESRFAGLLGVRAALACSSGTAAVHAAVATVDPEPGDEIITSPITDMGAIAPILYQGAIPVFADVDPDTGNVTPESVAACWSDRTRAVIVTHLFGNPCRVEEIRELAVRRGVAVIEDCAQAYLAQRQGRMVGTIGDISCFSMQQGKHITTGEGGLVATDDPARARRARVFVDKAWPYGEAGADHEFLALNARITELQAAVANAQLARLPELVAHRRSTVALLADAIEGLEGVRMAPVDAGDAASWWRVPLLVDEELGGPDALAAALGGLGVSGAPRYVRKPAFACRVIAEQRTFGDSRWPFTLARPEALDYSAERFRGAWSFLDRVLVLPWNERYEAEHAVRVADALHTAVGGLRGGSA